MRILHLVLKSKWYDKIASGEKTSEYRECKPYWNRRFCGYDSVVGAYMDTKYRSEFECVYERVIFHKGYTNNIMEFEIASLSKIHNMPNDLKLQMCWEIKLGKRIK